MRMMCDKEKVESKIIPKLQTSKDSEIEQPLTIDIEWLTSALIC